MIPIEEITEGSYRTGAVSVTFTWLTRAHDNPNRTCRCEFFDAGGMSLTHEDRIYANDDITTEVLMGDFGLIKREIEEEI